MTLRTVLVTNIKGGCGKTTLATNLAIAFAAGGLKTVIADADKQRSSLTWCALRPKGAANVRGVNWAKGPSDLPKDTQRLVIDGPAAIGRGEAEDLIKKADIVMVPVLPSIFDEHATARFVERIEKVKAIRKNRKPLVMVANRVRLHTRATERLDTFLQELGHEPAAHILERAVYGELACQGLSLFDVNTRAAYDNALHWLPLLETIEDALREIG